MMLVRTFSMFRSSLSSCPSVGAQTLARCFMAMSLILMSIVTVAHNGEDHAADKQTHEQKGDAAVVITKAFVRGLPPGQKTTAAFFTLKNVSNATITLNELSSPVAERVEVHETTDANGQMQMRKLEGVTIAAGESIVFEPNGKHIMLMGLTKSLKEGEEVTLRLCFGEFCRMLVLPVVSVLNESAHSHHNHH